jgi:hypothetical protein
MASLGGIGSDAGATGKVDRGAGGFSGIPGRSSGGGGGTGNVGGTHLSVTDALNGYNAVRAAVERAVARYGNWVGANLARFENPARRRAWDMTIDAMRDAFARGDMDRVRELQQQLREQRNRLRQTPRENWRMIEDGSLRFDQDMREFQRNLELWQHQLNSLGVSIPKPLKSRFVPFKGTDFNIRDNVFEAAKNGRFEKLDDIKSAASNIENATFRKKVIAKAKILADL